MEPVSVVCSVTTARIEAELGTRDRQKHDLGAFRVTTAKNQAKYGTRDNHRMTAQRFIWTTLGVPAFLPSIAEILPLLKS